MTSVDYVQAIIDRGGVPNTVYLELLAECADIIRRARQDLGADLAGGSLVDLLADNTKESLDVIRLVLRDLGEEL